MRPSSNKKNKQDDCQADSSPDQHQPNLSYNPAPLVNPHQPEDFPDEFMT